MAHFALCILVCKVCLCSPGEGEPASMPQKGAVALLGACAATPEAGELIYLVSHMKQT